MGAVDEAQLRFNILGPLQAWANGTRLRLGGAIQERVLVTLLLELGKVVPVSRLVAAIWADDPPATAPHQVRKAIANLRNRIPAGGEVLATDGPGYRAMLATDQLDLAEFSALVSAAREARAAGRPADAAQRLRAALALCRGPVLSGSGGPVIEAAATAFEERRLAAAEQLMELRLTLGEASELIGDLRELIGQHPLRESMRGQLMLALYRSGRQAEALVEYGKVRSELVEELGIEPGPQLSGLYGSILREDPGLAAPEPPPATAPDLSLTVSGGLGSPRTLPYDLADFTGRQDELRQLLGRAERAGESGLGIVAIDGMGGAGKTSLAVRAAHLLAEAYPDGQLYIDLRGHTPGEQPLTAAAALDTLLRTLGLPGDRIPHDLAGRTALWRTALTGKRLLLLLDNAVDAADLLPLLPTASGCLVLITSRARILELDGAEWISIDVMQPEDSATLIVETVGARRVAAEPEAAADLARLCGHLPLALRIVTARLRNRPRWTLTYLTDRLRDENRRLDELSSGERGVATALRLSYQALDAERRRAFRILALHPSHDLNVHSAAALLGSTSREAEDTLELLLDVHLLLQSEIGFYTFHDLVRRFAQSLRGGSTDQEDTEAAQRLLDYYLTATEAACDTLFPGRRRRPTGIEESTAELPPLQDAEQAQVWFGHECTPLISAAGLAERTGFDRHAACLGRNLAFYLNARGHVEQYREVSRTAVMAARRLDDPALLCVSQSNLSVACWKLGRNTEGIEAAEDARDLAANHGDLHTEAHSEGVLGIFKSLLGRFPESLAHLERAIACARKLGSLRTEAESLTILSTLHEQWGCYDKAEAAARRSLELVRQLGHSGAELVCLTDLAFAQVGLGDYREAAVSLAAARQLCDVDRDPGHVALTLALSADVVHELGDAVEALDYAARAHTLLEQSASPLRRSKAENVLGRLRRRRTEFPAALALHTHAHTTAAAISYRTEEAYALAGMAQAAAALGDEPAAARHRSAAEELFAAMGVPPDRRRG